MVSEKPPHPYRMMNIDAANVRRLQRRRSGPSGRGSCAPLIEALGAGDRAGARVAAGAPCALYDARLFKMLLPRSCGGEEVEPATFVAAVEEIAKADASTAWCVAQASGCSLAAAYLEPAVAREIFGGADAVLAWGPVGPNAKATAVDGGYRVTGTWSYASGSRHAQWLGGHSPLVDADGKPCLGADGKPTERTMLFPKSKARRQRRLAGRGPQGHRQRHLHGDRSVRAGALHLHPRIVADRRETDRCIASPPIRSTARASPRWRSASRARRSMPSSQWPPTKVPMLATKPLRENAVVQSKVAVAEARMAIVTRLSDADARADVAAASRGENLTMQQRAALRLAAVHAIHQVQGGRRDRLSPGRRLGDLREPGVRAAAARHPRGDAAGAVAIRQFEVAGQVLLGLPSRVETDLMLGHQPQSPPAPTTRPRIGCLASMMRR